MLRKSAARNALDGLFGTRLRTCRHDPCGGPKERRRPCFDRLGLASAAATLCAGVIRKAGPGLVAQRWPLGPRKSSRQGKIMQKKILDTHCVLSYMGVVPPTGGR